MSSCCRLCLSYQATLESIYKTRNNHLIADLIKIICPISIEKNEQSLSENICEECLEIVLSAINLRVMSVENDLKYRNLVIKKEPGSHSDHDPLTVVNVSDLTNRTGELSRKSHQQVVKRSKISEHQSREEEYYYEETPREWRNLGRNDEDIDEDGSFLESYPLKYLSKSDEDSSDSDYMEDSNRERKLPTMAQTDPQCTPSTSTFQEGEQDKSEKMEKFEISDYLFGLDKISRRGTCKICKRSVYWSRKRTEIHLKTCLSVKQEEPELPITQERLGPDFEFTINKQKSKKLYAYGYGFIKNFTGKNKIYWKCESDKTAKCYARACTVALPDGTHKVVRADLPVDHTHPRNFNESERRRKIEENRAERALRNQETFLDTSNLPIVSDVVGEQ